MREPWSSWVKRWHSHVVWRSLMKRRRRPVMHWWKMAIWKSPKAMRREWTTILRSTRVVWGKLSTFLRSTRMIWRELISFLWSTWVMRWELALITSVMHWRKLTTIFRSTRMLRWKLPILRRKLCIVLGSTRELWRKLYGILRQARTWKPAVFRWKLPAFLWSAEIRGRT